MVKRLGETVNRVGKRPRELFVHSDVPARQEVSRGRCWRQASEPELTRQKQYIRTPAVNPEIDSTLPDKFGVQIRLVDKLVRQVQTGRSAAVREASAAAGADVLRLVCDTTALRRLSANRIRTQIRSHNAQLSLL